MTIYDEIRSERVRQEQLRREGRFTFTCASREMTNAQRLTVLAEEYGEVAHEVNEGIGEGRTVDTGKLRQELIQTAAVAVAWLEGLGSEMGMTLAELEVSGHTNVDFSQVENFGRLSARYVRLVEEYQYVSNYMIVVRLKQFAEYCASWAKSLL